MADIVPNLTKHINLEGKKMNKSKQGKLREIHAFTFHNQRSKN